MNKKDQGIPSMSTYALVKKQSTAPTVLHVTGSLIVIMGLLLLVPLVPLLIFREFDLLKAFLLPAALSLAVGFALRLIFPSGSLYFKHGLLVCGLSWFVLCILPIGLLIGVPLFFIVRAVLRARKRRKSADETEVDLPQDE